MEPRDKHRPQLADDELDADEVRRVLVEQHARLRVLLHALDAKAVAVIHAVSSPGPGLEAALEETVQALTDHIRGEERAIVKLLPRTPESERALERLHEEHARQGHELESMRRCPATLSDAISLALTVRAFVADVLLDMDFEDRRYLSVESRISERT